MSAARRRGETSWVTMTSPLAMCCRATASGLSSVTASAGTIGEGNCRRSTTPRSGAPGSMAWLATNTGRAFPHDRACSVDTGGRTHHEQAGGCGEHGDDRPVQPRRTRQGEPQTSSD